MPAAATSKAATRNIDAPIKPERKQVRKDLERQVDEFSARIRMLELDLRAAGDEMRGLKEDTEEAQKKASALEIAKVICIGSKGA